MNLSIPLIPPLITCFCKYYRHSTTLLISSDFACRDFNLLCVLLYMQMCCTSAILSECKPVLSSCGCFEYVFQGKLFRSPKGIFRRDWGGGGGFVCFFCFGIVLFFEINTQLVFCVVWKAIAAYLWMMGLRMPVGGFSLVFSRTRNINYLIGGPSKIISFVTEHRWICDTDKKCQGPQHHSDGVSFFNDRFTSV